MKKLKIKKTITAAVAAVMVMTAIPACAGETVAPIAGDAPAEISQNVPLFLSYTGTVKEVSERDGNTLFVTLESEADGPANFVINKNTHLIDHLEIKVGQELIGFYESNRPMLLIYPPQYPVSIVAEVKDNLFVEADKFDKDLVNTDNSLKLNISEDTEIVWENGTQMNWVKAPTAEELKAALSERRLVVFYDVSTRSIPAQTTPKKIIVLSKKESAPTGDVSGFDIEVNGKTIAAAPAFRAEDGTVMLPVRAIAEALGIDVGWEGKSQTITVGAAVSFAIGDKSYRAYGAATELAAAPILKDGLTYVPMAFFKTIMPLYDAEIYEGRIVLNN